MGDLKKKCSGKDAGFTLVEVLIAVFITSIALIALASLAGTAIKATEAGRKRTQAANLATQKLETLKKVSYSKIQTTDTSAAAGISRSCGASVGTPPVFTCTPTLQTDTLGTIFTWRWKVTYVDLDNDACYFAASPCGAGPVIDRSDIKKVDVEVLWTDLLGSHTLTLTALRAI